MRVLAFSRGRASASRGHLRPAMCRTILVALQGAARRRGGSRSATRSRRRRQGRTSAYLLRNGWIRSTRRRGRLRGPWHGWRRDRRDSTLRMPSLRSLPRCARSIAFGPLHARGAACAKRRLSRRVVELQGAIATGTEMASTGVVDREVELVATPIGAHPEFKFRRHRRSPPRHAP